MSPLTEIHPVQRLPPHPGRLGEGGLRLNTADTGKPWLSVVTIALNPGDLLLPTMKSVFRWPATEVEYIVVDGGSTDATREILRENAQRLEYWVSEPDHGISDAFNKGVSLCRGEVIGLINAGDWYEADALERIRGLFQEHPDTGIVCGGLQFWDGNTPAYRCDSEPALLHREMSVTHPTCFVRRQLYLEYGGFSREYRLAMDYELLLRLRKEGVTFVSTRAVLANMIHDGLAEQNWQAALKETHQARQQYLPGSVYASPVYLAWLIGRKRIRFILESLGLEAVVRLYRERFAAVQKVRAEE
ncbi:MAG: hypothetical protein CSA34_03005 [Desulfobulbus propionicus]|nr:MAG: hypothetical protein CSA34_03005 [Desulfobulbus propionicus]